MGIKARDVFREEVTAFGVPLESTLAFGMTSGVSNLHNLFGRDLGDKRFLEKIDPLGSLTMYS